MKLWELIDFEPKNSSTTNKTYIDKLSTIGHMKGSGAFGKTYSIPSGKRLNQVSKVGKTGVIDQHNSKSTATDIAEDAYLTYLKIIHDSGTGGNPYFPRIHDLKIMKDSEGLLTYKVNMEKLVPYSAEYLFYNELLVRSLWEDMFTTPYRGSSASAIVNKIAMYLGSYVTEYNGIKDDNLVEALQLINAILVEYPNFREDLHNGNVMWRITGSRPQIVLIDPIA